ncbi:MAG: hypothetical protein ACPIOQ_61545, partial [Promethearchaeia archaeon]
PMKKSHKSSASGNTTSAQNQRDKAQNNESSLPIGEVNQKDAKMHDTSRNEAHDGQGQGQEIQASQPGSRRSLRGHRIDYTKLCASKTFTNYSCHQCKTQITEDEENICCTRVPAGTQTLNRTESANSFNQNGQGFLSGNQMIGCKYRFCNSCLNQYRQKPAPQILLEMCNFTGQRDLTCGDIWKHQSGQYTCPVCISICECMSCVRNKQNQQNRMQKILKNMDKNEGDASMMVLSHRQQSNNGGKRGEGSHQRRGDDSGRNYESAAEASGFSLDHPMRMCLGGGTAPNQKGGNHEKGRMSLNSTQNISGSQSNQFQNAMLDSGKYSLTNR